MRNTCVIDHKKKDQSSTIHLQVRLRLYEVLNVSTWDPVYRLTNQLDMRVNEDRHLSTAPRHLPPEGRPYALRRPNASAQRLLDHQAPPPPALVEITLVNKLEEYVSVSVCLLERASFRARYTGLTRAGLFRDHWQSSCKRHGNSNHLS